MSWNVLSGKHSHDCIWPFPDWIFLLRKASKGKKALSSLKTITLPRKRLFYRHCLFFIGSSFYYHPFLIHFWQIMLKRSIRGLEPHLPIRLPIHFGLNFLFLINSRARAKSAWEHSLTPQSFRPHFGDQYLYN